MKKPIVFTDLDGTLLDYSTYSFEKALPALQLLKEKDIPLIICSSKTKKEIEYYRKKLGNNHPFISENGGGIFIPKNYFGFQIADLRFKIEETKDYQIIRLGASYPDLRKAIEELRDEGINVTGFGDMTVHELAEIAHMTIEEAEMAKERYFDEPFIYSGPPHKLPQLLKSINKKGFKFMQGRFYHILGSSNKGIAVSILIDLYKNKYKKLRPSPSATAPMTSPCLKGLIILLSFKNTTAAMTIKLKFHASLKQMGSGLRVGIRLF
ncbi:MAG: HAD-IIB family hydrolase [Thermodesulfovibrionales bacterium]|nr:HAD-IIB family hydrolase [Thermodesulfovibrionales bacterium]